MQPNYISVSTLFSSHTRHTVPLFQRPYVWSREDQWEPLWEDIKGLLNRLEQREGEAAVASHFLGTVVLEQVQNPTGSLPRREIIDGQQRLTTLQILLKAAEHALEAVGYRESADEHHQKLELARKQIASLTENLGEGDERYKVWPTNEDREPFTEVMNLNGGVDAAATSTRMSNAYQYFREMFGGYLSEDNVGAKAQRFAAALKDYLKLIVLDLDASDEPQAIFETLNAHGTPLLPADLMKNWLLWEATRQGLEAGHLYECYWRSFDKDHKYWRARVGTGHAARARVDTYLQNWLARATRETVSAKHLYDQFLRYAHGRDQDAGAQPIDIEALMRSIRSDSERFRRIDEPDGTSRFDVFLGRLSSMSLVVFHPLLLELMERADSGDADLSAVAEVLESYLVRRMVCGYQTRGYGTLAMRLLRNLDGAGPEAPSAQVLRAALLAEEGADAWPDDNEFREHWSRRRFYGGLRRDRVLMILKALEELYQHEAVYAEPVKTYDWSKLHVEHILPQTWQAFWPLPEDQSAENRNWFVHGIGNLTLVSGKLNPKLSNAAWVMGGGKGKKAQLSDHTTLELNRRLLKDHPDWSDQAIHIRAERLCEDALRIWPRG